MSKAKVIFEGKRVEVHERDGWEFVERKKGKSAVAVVAVTNDGKLILTEQYRRPVDQRVIDWPAGLVGDDGESDPESTARKELLEETGYECSRVEFLAEGPTSPGITSETVSLYRAHNLTKKEKGGGVGGEDIEVHEVASSNIEQWLRKKAESGVAVDSKIWAGLYFLRKSK